MSKRIPPSAPAKTDSSTSPTPPPRATPVLLVNLQDPGDFISKAKQSNRVFRVSTTGHPDTLENRFAALALKAYFHDQHEEVVLTDGDFLALALHGDNPATATAPSVDLNATWVLSDVSDLDVPSIEINPLKAHDLSRAGNDIAVGKLTIQRKLPKLTMPAADDLRAAGYSSSQ